MNIGTNVTGITIPEGAVKNIKRGTEMLWQDGGLPTAFQRCEYIESHGTEYILTSVLFELGDRIQCDFSFNKNYAWQSVFAAMLGTVGRLGVRFGGGHIGYFVADAYPQGSSGDVGHVVLNTKYSVTYEYTAEKARCIVDGTTLYEKSSPRIPTETTEWSLFKVVSSTKNNDPAYARMYSFILTNEEQKRLHLIPAYLKTDWNGIPAGTIGLYDLCGSLSSNGTPFYTNEGTGEFTKGADVV